MIVADAVMVVVLTAMTVVTVVVVRAVDLSVTIALDVILVVVQDLKADALTVTIVAMPVVLAQLAMTDEIVVADQDWIHVQVALHHKALITTQRPHI
jgi:hypothetical protein